MTPTSWRLRGRLGRLATGLRPSEWSRRRPAAPILFLLVAAPLLPEVFVSHNTSVTALSQTAIGPWLVVGYGIPILFIRELWSRRELPLVSLPVLGVAYGILNEGIIAHTLAQTGGDPVGGFVGYGTVAGIHLTWATYILTWHAIHSVMVPILLAHVLFPGSAGSPWLSRRWFVTTGVLTGLLYAFYGRGGLPAVYSIWHFLAYILATVLLVGLATRLKRPERGPARASRPPRFGPLVAFGAIVLTGAYTAGFATAPIRVLPATIYVLCGWAAFGAVFAVTHRRRWSARQLLTPLLANAVTFSIVIGIAIDGVLPIVVSVVFAILVAPVLVTLRADWSSPTGS